jgi:hypothetical protein
MKCLEDRVLAARVHVALLEHIPALKVHSHSGSVVIEVRAPEKRRESLTRTIQKILGDFPGIESLEVRLLHDILREAAEEFR